MPVTGKDGSVLIGTNRIAELDNWTLNLGADDIDVTNFDSDGWKEFLSGLKEWDGSIEGNFKGDDTNGQKALLAAWLAGEKLEFEFKVNDTISFSGSAYVRPNIEVPVGDKATISCDIRGTGPLTLPS